MRSVSGLSRRGTTAFVLIASIGCLAAGCSDTRLTFTQSGKEGPEKYRLTPRRCTWTNLADGGCCLSLLYQWDTHAGQFILEGVRSNYLRIIIRLPDQLEAVGSSLDVELQPGMVQAYDDHTPRGICYTGGPGRITLRCIKDAKVLGTFEVTCRGFLPGRGPQSLFSDDYVLSAQFEAEPDAEATLRAMADVGWFFTTPERRSGMIRRRSQE